MNRRYGIYFGLIGLLVVVNLGRWWWRMDDGQRATREKTFAPEDFRLRVDVPDAGASGRNLFAAGGYSRTAGEGSARKVAHDEPSTTVVAGPLPQAETVSGIGRLKLLGVVFHGGKRQAYLALEKDNVIADSGDTVFGQYAVDKITVDAVELRDVKNNVTKKIPVSGK